MITKQEGYTILGVTSVEFDGINGIIKFNKLPGNIKSTVN